MNSSRLLRGTVGASVVLGVALAWAFDARAEQQAARYTTFAVDMTRSVSGPVEIVVTRWSSEEESTRFMTTLVEQGPAKLLEAVRDFPRVGSISTPGNVGIEVRLAQRTRQPNGTTKVTLVMERPVGFAEQVAQPRSLDYPFMMVELTLNPNGTGEGKLTLATKITWERASKTMMIENYNDQPVRLQNVKEEK